MDPTIVITLLTGAISTLFGLLINEWRQKDKSQRERIEKLEKQLTDRDNIIKSNTDTLGDVTTSTSEILSILQDVIRDDPSRAQRAVNRRSNQRVDRYEP